MKSRTNDHITNIVRPKVRFYSQTLERRRYLGGVFYRLT